MSKPDETTEETKVTEEEKPAETPEGEKPEEETKVEETEENKESEGDKLSHDDALQALTKTRTEAANWRTKFRELEKSFAEAKTPEQVAELVTQMTTDREAAEQALVVENVALKHKLTEDLTEVLVAASQGKKREELEAHAATLAKYVPSEDEPEPELSGGLDPTDADGDGFDPVAASRKARARRW